MIPNQENLNYGLTLIHYLEGNGISFRSKCNRLGIDIDALTAENSFLNGQLSSADIVADSEVQRNFSRVNLAIVQLAMARQHLAFTFKPIVQGFVVEHFNNRTQWNPEHVLDLVFDSDFLGILFITYKSVKFYKNLPRASQDGLFLNETLNCINTLLTQNVITANSLHTLNNDFFLASKSNLC